MVTLGCSKNLVDSEKLLCQLHRSGLRVVHNSEETGADIVVINTCGFIGDAKEESVDTILNFIQAKERGEVGQVFVMGCLSERYKTELQNEIPDVDKYFGVNDLAKIVESIGASYSEHLIGERFLTTPSHYAYLKVSEGCDRKCSFCAIPMIRGKHLSVPEEQLVHEAEFLAGKGVKELILIAQDLTYYGLDLYGKRRLASLLEKLTDSKGIEWIRLHYAYPAGFPEEVLVLMRENEKICRYLDIPFQHVSDPVLKNMRRGNTRRQSYELIRKFRAEVPGLALRTTLMVGHPGEGEKEFRELLDFVRQMRFDRLGVFCYSEEENTWGAKHLQDTIAEDVKQERMEEIMDLQAGISLELNRDKIGKQYRVVIDRKEGAYFVGRTEADSPEVDNEVLITNDSDLAPGTFVHVRITKAEEFDLFGELEVTPSTGNTK